MASTVDTTGTHGSHDRGQRESYLTAAKGLKPWLLTLDHKRIGLMYLVSLFVFFFVGIALAIGLRTELWTPNREIVSQQAYNQLFTLHGAIMIFLFLVPSIPASLGNFLLPMMLGAKGLAFPRLNLASFHLYVLGAVFFILTAALGGLDTGWTLYTPYSISTDTAVILATVGLFILGLSSVLTAINFLVTIHKMRAPGLTWGRLPLFAWGLYATALVHVLATPVLAITLLLLVAERTFGVGLFNPELGGDPVLFQHFFWFYAHPVVYATVLPGFGIISEIVTSHSRKGIFGYRAMASSSLAIAFLSFVVWGQHMFVSGQSALAGAVFSFLTFAVAVPTAIKVFGWIATMHGGSIRYTTPMWYMLSFLFLFTIGGLAGLLLGSLSTSVHLHDTYFAVAQFHYVLMGGTFIAFAAGIHHWWPKITGKMYDERVGFAGALLIFIGFNVTFFSQLVMGANGMPRRYYSYVQEFQIWHQISTLGSYLLAAGLFIAAGNLLLSLRRKTWAEENPWGGISLEWKTATPPLERNFVEQPIVRGGPYDFPGLDRSTATDGADTGAVERAVSPEGATHPNDIE